MKEFKEVTLAEMKKFKQDRFDESMKLIDRKGADYNREQQLSGDTLFNLRVAHILGVTTSTEQSILVRLMDKIMRLISLTKPGIEAAVKDESVLDTINDLHNYADFLGIVWLKSRESNQQPISLLQTQGIAKSLGPSAAAKHLVTEVKKP